MASNLADVFKRGIDSAGVCREVVAPNVDWIEVDYPTLVADAALPLARIAKFLGTELLPLAHKMALPIERSLYRHNRVLAAVIDVPHGILK